MTVTRDQHSAHGATFTTAADREVPAHYGRPTTAHRAVRNGVGVIEMAYDILAVTGGDRTEFVDAAVSTTVTADTDTGTFGLILDVDGHTIADVYLYAGPDQLLVFLPPGTAGTVGDIWRDRIVRRDVTIEVVTSDFGVFGVHGPSATEKIASILNGAAAPDGSLAIARGHIDGDGVTIIRSDNRVGEEGYEVICTATDADDILASLLTKGLNAAPFGHDTWLSLTLEAGTPLFGTELADRIPVGLVGGGYDRNKGCYPGQEVIARIEDRGHPPGILVGLTPDDVPDANASVTVDGTDVGVVTRAGTPPTFDAPAAFAILDPAYTAHTVTIADDITADPHPLPFVETGPQSERIPEPGSE